MNVSVERLVYAFVFWEMQLFLSWDETKLDYKYQVIKTTSEKSTYWTKKCFYVASKAFKGRVLGESCVRLFAFTSKHQPESLALPSSVTSADPKKENARGTACIANQQVYHRSG